MIFREFTLLTFLFISTIAYSQNGYNTSGEQINEKSGDITQNKLPIPNQLASGWGEYFNSSNQHLLERINEAKQQYSMLLLQLDQSDQETARQQITRLINNLFAIHQLRQPSETILKSVPENVKDSYSIDEWLTINDSLRKEKADYADNQAHIETQTAALKAAKKKLSSLLLKYADMEPAQSEKMLLGFRILAEKSAIEVNSEQLKINKAALDNQSSRHNDLRKLCKSATLRLRSDQKYSDQIDLLITALQQKLAENQITLRKILAETVGVLENDPILRSQARLLDQKAINHMIEAEIITSEIASLEAKKDLSHLLLHTDKKNIAAIHERLQQWREFIVTSRQNANIWNKDTSRELIRIQEKMLNQPLETDNNGRLGKLLSQRLQMVQSSLIELKHLEIEWEKLNIICDELDKRILHRSGRLFYLFNWSASQAQDFWDDLISWSIEPLFSIGDTPVTTAGLVRALLIISIAGLISYLFRRGMSKLSERIDANGKGVSVFYTVGRLSHYIILLLGIIIALSTIGLDFTNLALVAGALSVGIGFGLQSIVNNFVSGLILLFEGTIKVGDFIELESGVMGLVKEINVRNTQINTNDNVDIIVPNSVLVSNQVVNWTLREANRRIRVPFGVAYGSNKDLVKKAALDAADRVRYTHKPKYLESAQKL